MNRILSTAAVALAVGWVGTARADEPAAAVLEAPTAEPYEALDARLNEVEKQLAALRRRLRILAADDESEAIGREVFDDPRWLLETALEMKLEGENWERAYRYLALIHQLHPESPEARRAFPYAARIFTRQYRVKRIHEPHSIWLEAEFPFLLNWLGTLYEPGFYPEQDVEMLVKTLPFRHYAQFLAYAQGHPEMRKWHYEPEEDNGKLIRIHATPIEDGAAP